LCHRTIKATKIHPGTTHGAWNTGHSASDAIVEAEVLRAAGKAIVPEDMADLREKVRCSFLKKFAREECY
jgi:hypothetical protein